LINKTFSQLNAERAARRAGPFIIKSRDWKRIKKSYKPQAASALKQTQLKDRIKT
jgi:hypothetical protein